jgi:hypothetical protein
VEREKTMAGITGVAGSAAASANMMASTEYRVFDFRDMFYCPISMQVAKARGRRKLMC